MPIQQITFFWEKKRKGKKQTFWVRKNLPLVFWQLMNLVWEKVVQKFNLNKTYELTPV